MEYYARVCFLSDVFTSCEISNFPTHLEVNTADRKHTPSY